MNESFQGLPDVPEVAAGDRLMLREAWLALTDAATAARRAILYDDAALPAYLAHVEARSKDTPLPSRIEVLTLYDAPAREVIAQGVARLTYLEEQHPKAVERLPGVLACSASTLDTLTALNAAKAVFERRASALTQKQWKALRIRTDYARVNLLYAYRRVPVLASAPEKVSFSWLSQNVSIQRLSVRRARELVLTSLGRAFELSARQRQEMQTEDMAALAGLQDDEVLAVRRALQPVPEVNWWLDQTPEKPIKAVLPLAFPAGAAGVWPAIRELGDLVVQRNKAPSRSDARCESDPLIPRLDLYRYREQYRECEADQAGAAGSVQLQRPDILFGPAQPPVRLSLPAQTWPLLVDALGAVLRGQGVQNLPTPAGTLRLLRRRHGVGISLHDPRGEMQHSGLLPRADAATAVACDAL
ncbi:hypothetical protein E4T66_18265 [Sinimarinibacterium sp. CAU 1509]|uniref:DNA replication terminus site-binding protein n=1 Tax=Sinimarinibacterium sp. CAU 1509 TaxID=2562283 RepID=UPI0010AB773B|nr:DNA replication terminus site-binding protein [Sinimarinibacterium sp. CAU 1509]TJY57351.1 hypothetical protein E4T66_18265 [Sinimarinibacterium sp. CAU 1509]